jgi:hypothetical protein
VLEEVMDHTLEINPNTNVPALIPIENKYRLLTTKCVCLCVIKISLNAENKKTRYLLRKWKPCEEKSHSGAAKPRISTLLKMISVEC